MKPNVFQVIDLDRTLFDTSRFARAVTEIVETWEPGLGNEINERFEATYKSEVTFFVLEFIRERFGVEKYAELIEEVKKNFTVGALLLPGAKERIEQAESLTSARPAYGILTMAHSPEDQYMKLELAGLNGAPLIITDTPDKAEIIRSWVSSDGGFNLPSEFGGIHVDSLTFEDDKIRAFVGMPDNVIGVWVTKREDAVAQLEHAGLQTLGIAKDLYESFAYLQEKIS